MKQIHALPIGYSQVWYDNKRYGVSRTDLNNHQNVKVYAEELGGDDIVSFNFYPSIKTNSLKPCEMSKEKVILFLKNYTIIK